MFRLERDVIVRERRAHTNLANMREVEFAGALVAGLLTDGTLNPARSLGPTVAAGMWTARWL